MEQKISIRKTRLREPHFPKSSSSENFLKADWWSLALLHLTEILSPPTVWPLWRPRFSDYLLPRLSSISESDSDSLPSVKWIREDFEAQHATILSGTVKLVTFVPPAVYVMDGVGKILSQE
jgi:hypothetical protein